MKKLVGVLVLASILCGFAEPARADSVLTPWLALRSYYNVSYHDENIYIGLDGFPGTFQTIEFFEQTASGTFSSIFKELFLVIEYDAASRYAGSEYVFINILADLPSLATMSGYYNSTGVFFDTWEMSLKKNYDILVPYININPEGGGYYVGHYPETIGIEATISMTTQGYLNILFSVYEPFESPNPVPIPAAALLLGSGLGGLAVLRRKIK